MPDFLDWEDLYRDLDFDAEGNLPHTWTKRKNNDVDNFSESYSEQIWKMLDKKEKIDLYLEYRIDELSDEGVREEFHSIFERIVDIETNINSNDLLEIKKWIINAKEEQLAELLIMHSDYSLWFHKLSITDIVELLCYVIDNINWIHDDEWIIYNEE